jgi:predicted kinase
MATLYLICGLPGAGKTTLARELKLSENALRLCPDVWISTILADPMDISELDRLRSPIESIQWEVAKRALSLGMNVILEWGFWSKQERDYYRTEARSLGASVRLFFLEVGLNEIWNRLEKRNSNLPPGTFKITRENLEEWSKLFEPPTLEELSNLNHA